MIRAEIALADGDHDTARTSLDRIAEHRRGLARAAVHRRSGSLLAELERRSGDLAAARAAIDDALDAIEFCSEDLPRIARLSETGAWIEADTAARARDLGDDDALRRRSRAPRASWRAEACAGEARPVEAARLASGRADLARARDEADPELDAAAVEAWRAVPRPYPAAIAQLRQAETLVRRRRDEAAAVIAGVLEAARSLGAPWLLGEAEGLAARARLALAGAPARRRPSDERRPTTTRSGSPRASAR